MQVNIHSADGRGNIVTLLKPVKISFRVKSFVAHAGFECDGVSVPRFAWPLVTPHVDPRSLRAGVAHDYIYRVQPEGWTRAEADLPADFLNAVAPARLVTALPNADGGGSVETVDRFWLPSRTEIFGVLNGGIAEGMQMTKYIDATDADRIKYNAAGNSASWYLRSANTTQPHYVAFVERTGIFSTSFLVSRDALPACIIA